MKITRYILSALVVVVLVALVYAATYTPHPEIPPHPETWIADGEIVYLEYCAECHQANGSGWSDLYPRLAGNPIVTLHDPWPIISTVLFGQGSMPAFRNRLTADQIAAVLSYIRNSWGNEAAAISPRSIH